MVQRCWCVPLLEEKLNDIARTLGKVDEQGQIYSGIINDEMSYCATPPALLGIENY